MRAWWMLWGCSAGVLGCGPQQQVVPRDQLCVVGEYRSPDGAIVLREGVPLRMMASHGSAGCRSACDTVIARHCALTREGNTFRLSSEVVVEVDCRGDDPVPSCVPHGAECTTEPLTAGTYVLTDGRHTLQFQVPSVIPSDRNCTGSTP